MPFQKGNRANPGGRPKDAGMWREAIVMAVKRQNDEDPKSLAKLADKLLSLASEGDMAAIKELGDRLDGKAAQELNVAVNEAPTARVYPLGITDEQAGLPPASEAVDSVH